MRLLLVRGRPALCAQSIRGVGTDTNLAGKAAAGRARSPGPGHGSARSRPTWSLHSFQYDVGSRQRALDAVSSASVIDYCFSLPETWRMTETKPSGETTAVQDYLKAIHELNVGGEAAATSLIAERLGVAAGSVTGML